MSIFGNIMKKLGFGDDAPKTEPETEAVAATEEVIAEAPETENASSEPAEPEVAVEAVEVVDVVAKLETLSEQNPGLNWKTSIVDLMKLLGLDSGYAHRKELASEMGIEDYEGTAEQNIALHKAVLEKIAQNGGNIPEELLH